MLTESELKWLRERKPIKHTCADCWTKQAIKSSPFLQRDRYFSRKNDEPSLEDECDACKWMPRLSSDDTLFDCWKDATWYEWDDEQHLDYHLTEKGKKEIRVPDWGWGPLDFRDAAEFEARVAKLLSEPDAIEKKLVCWNWPEEKLPCEDDKDADCRRCRLKVARLIAEKEMDG